MTSSTGPYLQAALLCERVIEEKDGVLSVMRIIDRLIHTAMGSGAPEIMPPLTHAMTALVILKSGTARGPVQVRIDMEEPSGLVTPGPSMTALMEGEDRGQNLIMGMQTTFKEAGLYWFSVYLDEQLATRMPFRVVYTRIAAPPRSQ